MKKILVVFVCLLTVTLSTMFFSARSLSAPNFADYPRISLGRVHKTNLKANECADSAQTALKQSGFSRIGSSNPGSSLFGAQDGYVGGVTWDAEMGVYTLVIAGPDKTTVENYAKTLRQNAAALFEK